MDAAAVMSLLAVSTGTAHSAATVIITENAGITLMVAGAVKEGEDGPETSARSFEVFPE